MSRSGYTDDCDEHWQIILFRGAVKAAIRGKRGQQFLRDLITALDAIQTKRLIENALETDGEVCALGSVGKMRHLSMSAFNVYDDFDRDSVATLFGIAPVLAQEIMYENDEGYWGNETPEHRWKRMRQWAVDHIRVTP